MEWRSADTSTGETGYQQCFFTPLPRFLCLPPEERAKFIFPDDWDITSIKEVQAPGSAPAENAGLIPDQAVSMACDSRLYGGVWLLERIAEETGLREDLLITFSYNQAMVDDIMTITMFQCLTGYNVDRLAEWQCLEKYPSKRILSPQVITELEQSITCQNKMDLYQCRALRAQDDVVLAVDSPVKTAFNGKLINAAWGQNKEGLHLPASLEVTVYSLKQHTPVYTTTLQGNLNDSSSVDNMIADLTEKGLNNPILIVNRAYSDLKHLRKYIVDDIRMIGCMKVTAGLSLDRIKGLETFELIPDGFLYAEVLDLYVRQFDIPYSVKCDDGSEKAADRLKLNLYYDPVGRVKILTALDQEMSAQREELTKAIQKGDIYHDLQKKAIEDHYDVFHLQWKEVMVPIDKCPEMPGKKGRKPGYEARYVLIGFSENHDARLYARKTAGFRALITLGQGSDPVQAMLDYGVREEQEREHNGWVTSPAWDRERNATDSTGIGSSFIQFVSRIMDDNLRYKWKRDVRLKKLFRSTLQLTDEMRSIKCFEDPKQLRLMITPFTERQREACELLGYSVPKECKP